MDDGSLSPDSIDASAPERRGEALPSPLRDEVVALALGRGESEAQTRFERFLAGTTSGETLLVWYGRQLDSILTGGADALRVRLDRDIADLDLLIADAVNAILHHADFQRLESSWRGLLLLLDAAQDDEKVKIRILSASWDELGRDFERASEFDQSALFNKIYNEEFGSPGGTPYGLILCDYAVQHRRNSGRPGSRIDDISALSTLSSIGAAAFAPCIVGAAPALLGIESFTELSYVQDVHSLLRSQDHIRWRQFQQRADSRFLGIVLPRVLLRRDWADDGTRREGFRFAERGEGTGGNGWLWGNGVYAFGTVVVRSYRENGWFADIRGTRKDAEEAGVIASLPAPRFSTGEPTAYRRPLEVGLTDRKQKLLEELGFITLSPCHMTPHIALLGSQSVHSEAFVGSEAYQANSRLSSMLQYMLCVSRFAHYVKVIARDRVGAYTTAADLQLLLSNWLRQYMIGNKDAGNEMKARHPLFGGSVEIVEAPGKPGTFGCTIHLQPHFQIDHMVAAFRLYTELAGLRAA